MDSSEIRINNGVLWIDSEAYPLRNISRVGSRWIDPQPIKAAAVRAFIIRTFICLIVAGIVGTGSAAGGVIIFLAGMAVLIWRLSLALKLQPIYGLVLNTSGVQQDAVWSYEEDEVRKLVVAITEAIGHPDTAQMILNLNHVVGGDVIQQYGSASVGKQVGAGAGR
ncbi:DUF6232 family protein [Amycolatopsis sp. H20-H5]|uniref:DUF6232 family protein n=1 Tax=Amycolatopsis sp. H20-H5 TaxID=3046309 RepID=UPI002DBCDD8B|nr:DUF6232 family protein [Amycolatopsis sp. H20-H5]MEC3982390.1 DUF6232 family protein [Amycolatopsis sp. H20-H5]